MSETMATNTIFRNILHNLGLYFRHPTALAVGCIFAVDSCMFGTWVTLIPFVKTKFYLSDGELGLVLFGMPIGLLIANPFAARAIARLGLVRLTLVTTVLMALAFVLPLWATNSWILFGCLLLLGLILALMNVGMNTCATHIEEAEGRKIMSTCHGMWSLGGMLGAAYSALMLKWGVFPPYYLAAQAIAAILFTLLVLRGPLARVPQADATPDSNAEAAGFALPTGDLLFMVLIGACTSLCEGIAFDWSAVYLRDTLHATAQVAALGFTCFSLSMMTMRFAGDALIPLYGERNLLNFTVIASACSLFTVVVAPNIGICLLGFLLLGASVALAAPILFNAAARVPGFAPGAGLATYATFSFIGFLVGPPAIGLVSEVAGLSKGFLLVALCTLATVLCVRQLRHLRGEEY
jgi:predicted MFS family arabinose efflux permease